MPYAVAVAPIGTSKIVCVDCLQRLDAAAARALRADGFVAAGRYVNCFHKGIAGPDVCTMAEMQAKLATMS
jgi:hypothetical protein